MNILPIEAATALVLIGYGAGLLTALAWLWWHRRRKGRPWERVRIEAVRDRRVRWSEVEAELRKAYGIHD